MSRVELSKHSQSIPEFMNVVTSLRKTLAHREYVKTYRNLITSDYSFDAQEQMAIAADKLRTVIAEKSPVTSYYDVAIIARATVTGEPITVTHIDGSRLQVSA